MSPGSRNAPLILALDESDEIDCTVVTDERSAAFTALGMAQVSRRPVALVCTSGSAMLNYAPALAEAYYQRLPLVAVTADRPMQWIDQDDSQTIRQPGALSQITRMGVDIPDFSDPHGEMRWYAARKVNDALLAATGHIPGPVHINVQLEEPLLNDWPDLQGEEMVKEILCEASPSKAEMKKLAERLQGKKVLLVCGFLPPDNALNRAVSAFASLDNVAVLTETISNIHAPRVHDTIDRLLTLTRGRREFNPDIVLTIGGALISRHLKTWLRNLDGAEHWSIGWHEVSADVFKHLSLRIEGSAAPVLKGLYRWSKNNGHSTGYSRLWDSLSQEDAPSHESKVSDADWSSLQALGMILPRLPKGMNLQLSNGTCVRYAQLFGAGQVHAQYCNRGVSGIDGCTSTAVGAAMAYSGPTLLITGDMSLGYDLTVLSLPIVPQDFKVIVINNSGGGIFRFINSMQGIDPVQRERYFCAPRDLKLPVLSQAWGYKYHQADSQDALNGCLNEFLSYPGKGILEIIVPPEQDAQTLRNYFI